MAKKTPTGWLGLPMGDVEVKQPPLETVVVESREGNILDQDTIDFMLLESRVNTDSTPKNFGIRKTDLQTIKERHGRSGETLVYNLCNGLYNLVIPDEMLVAMNPDEVVALYLAAGIMKEGSYHNKKPRKVFDALYKEMNRTAFKYISRSTKQIDKKGDWRRRFPNEKGSLAKRFEVSTSKYGDGFKQRFVNSFYENFKEPDTKQRREMGYHDDTYNADDKGRPAFINEAMRKIGRIYEGFKARRLD